MPNRIANAYRLPAPPNAAWFACQLLLVSGLLLAIPLSVPVVAVESVGEKLEGNDQFFEERVRPLLVEKCHSCHGSKKQESDLRLDSRSAILAGGASGQALVPHHDPRDNNSAENDPGESLLIGVVRGDGDLVMPPNGRLTAEEIEILTAWIRLGLPWPESPAPAQRTAIERAAVDRQSHWSFSQVVQPKLPTLPDDSWCRSPIDYFVLSRLNEAGIDPSMEADRRTLIRRISFDLLGVPPPVDQVDAFVADPRPDAYSQLVERTLASPRYGERWGRHWLDVARYADTKGYAFAGERRFAFAYTYRDYVIAAFSADLPYDRFIVEQLAADQLASSDPARLAALGFLTVGRRFNNRQDDIDDQIDVVSRGFLGLTVACARCHAHKYDAIPTEDYYSLYGVFASCYEPQELPLVADPIPSPELDTYRQELARLEGALSAFLSEQHRKLLDESRRRVEEYLVAVVDLTGDPSRAASSVSLGKDELKPRLLARWHTFLTKQAPVDDPLWGLFAEQMRLGKTGKADRFAKSLKRWLAMTAGTQNGNIHPAIYTALTETSVTSTHALARVYGPLLAARYHEWVEAGSDASARSKASQADRQLLDSLLADETPTAIPLEQVAKFFARAENNKRRELEKEIDKHQAHSAGAPPRAMVIYDQPVPHEPRVFIRGDARRPGATVPRQFLLLVAGDERSPFQQGSGRRELAEAIASPANPLTRRVIANRVWMHHFGLPLVATPSDLGVRSEPPEHLDIIDYLASKLLDSRWSLKSLHREILLSSSYRQSSEYRSAPAAIDEENQLLWRMNRRRLEFEPLRDALLFASNRLDLSMYGRPTDLLDSAARRRTVYGFVDRQEFPNVLRAFDFASPDQSQARRPVTTVPQQSLFLMNSPFIVQQVRSLAKTIPRGEVEQLKHQVQRLYERLFARLPTEAEIQVARDFDRPVAAQAKIAAALSRWEQYVQLLLLTNEFAFID